MMRGTTFFFLRNDKEDIKEKEAASCIDDN